MSSPSSSPFWCHSCRSIVQLPPSSGLICPLCRDGFVEEFDGLNSGLSHSAAFFLASDDLLRRSSRNDSLRRRLLRRRSQANEMLSFLSAHGGHMASRSSDLWSFGESRALQHVTDEHRRRSSLDLVDRIQGLFARRRMRTFTGSNGSGLGSQRLVNIRDFFLGPEGELLIQQLIQGNGERLGSAPASKAAVEAMPTLTISKQSMEADEIHCAVCKEVFEIGGKAREMPCKHVYHSDCILPWLELHSSCPICRHELPSEDASERRARRLEESSVSGTRTEGVGPTGERGLAIVGIPGLGIRVQSFVLYGVAMNGSISPADQIIEPGSFEADLGHRASSSDSTGTSTSYDSSNGAAVVNIGAGDVGGTQVPTLHVDGLQPVVGEEAVVARRGRGFLSRLFSRFSSNNNDSTIVQSRRERRS